MAVARRWSTWVAVVAAAWTLAAPARAGTPAGTQIVNTARLTLASDADTPRAIDSNTVTVAVDALVDVAIAADQASVTIAGKPTPVGFTMINRGNAPGGYVVTATIDVTGASIAAIVADADGDGRYDPAHDRGDAAVTLSPSESRHVFVLVAGAVNGATVNATATARAGTGQPGTLLAGAGPAGTDAVIGATTGRASASSKLIVGGAAAQLDKAQSVVAPDGSARATVGAIVTYTLVARFARDCPAVEVSDAIPAGTRFVAGSITLDDQPLSDGGDADTGRLDSGTVRVALGDMPAGATRTIRFKAIIL